MARLDKIKKKLKKATVQKRKPVEPVKKEENPVLGTEEVAVEKTKFSTPQITRVSTRILEELPQGYGQDKIVLQVRDPRWVHAYWELTRGAWENLHKRFGDAVSRAKKLLRVYDVSDIIFNGKNAHRFFDLEIGYDAHNWYIDTGGPGRSWCVDLGLLLPDGRFITIVRSNIVKTPLEGPSGVLDEEWMIPDDMFARLYGMGFGFGRSSPIGGAWQERFRALFSGVLASPGMASMASPVKKPAERKFRLTVNTELIVYGASEPDAVVTVQGKPIKLRPDGTFSLRFALPDGKQLIPVEATSADKLQTKTITPIVNRETK